MKDLKLNSDWDLELESNDLTLVDGVDAIVQRLRAKLQLVRGEWFLDRSAGVPWFEEVLKKNPRSEVLRAVVRRPIAEDQDVERVESVSLGYDGETRTLEVEVVATLTNGERVTITTGSPVEA
ncbi:MAG: hypothetical protein ACOCU9_04215 [Spirochaetota bacterium]